MRKLTVVPLALAAVLLALALGSIVKADNWDKKTVVTFNQDVEIPGQVLPAGTYVFKLLRSNSDRTVVQVWSRGESQLLATLITIGDSLSESLWRTLLRPRYDRHRRGVSSCGCELVFCR